MLKLKLQYFGHWCKERTHWKRSWCWERLKAGGERDDRSWGGWMASSTRWTWVWADSRSWWRTGKPGVRQFMRSQRFRRDWATDLNWTELWGRAGFHILSGWSQFFLFFFFKDQQLFLVDWNGKRYSEIQGWPSSGTSHTFLTSNSKESHYLIAS